MWEQPDSYFAWQLINLIIASHSHRSDMKAAFFFLLSCSSCVTLISLIVSQGPVYGMRVCVCLCVYMGSTFLILYDQLTIRSSGMPECTSMEAMLSMPTEFCMLLKASSEHAIFMVQSHSNNRDEWKHKRTVQLPQCILPWRFIQIMYVPTNASQLTVESYLMATFASETMLASSILWLINIRMFRIWLELLWCCNDLGVLFNKLHTLVAR